MRAFERWPSYETFRADGRKGLHAALMRYGGPERWAAELGVALIARRPGRQLDEAQIRDSLRVLLRKHRPQRFFSQRWLTEHGPPGLASAMNRSGGAQRWARQLGVPGPKPPFWTDQLIERELRLLCAQHTHWPTTRQFLDAGQGGLLEAVRREHGSAWWAQRLELPQRRRSPTPRPH